MDDFAQRLLDKATVHHLQPEDILLIGNAGELVGANADQSIKDLQGLFPDRHVVIFKEDINVSSTPHMDACPYCSRPEGHDACPIHNDHP
jgi:hypothetical protein